MSIPRGVLICWILLMATAQLGPTQAADSAPELPYAEGTFAPNWDSLKQYECPEWFRDAKLGIWAHWSPQCVPGDGDWYARGMYQEGSGQYQFHLEHYGHPSQFGYKDIANLWTAANWEPGKLIDLYKRAGARYFVALANHHCNFDGWDSTYHEWNSVNVGPHRDIIGEWAKAARERGLKFGVTVHSARAWNWFEVAHGSDSQGPMKGVPYDGNLTKADGKGTWWEGLDPQELYCRAHEPGAPPDAEYIENWFLRTKDLIDKYRPDLLYFDDNQLPLGEAGFRIAAHYYNQSLRWHKGALENVLTTKGMPPELLKALVLDIERGISDAIEPYPWQTDTCIGQWHYLDNCDYKTPQQVIQMLVDIVSKNGNLLLSIPVRGDGTIDSTEVAILESMADWIAVNSEGIYGTRPWIVFGEGATRGQGGQFNEGQSRPYSARDIRFTAKDGALYAFALGWPEDGKLMIRSLAKVPGARGKVTGVRMLGHAGVLPFVHDENGLAVMLPEARPCEFAYGLKITGERLTEFRPSKVPMDYSIVVSPNANGDLILGMDSVEVHGGQARIETRAGQENIGFWDTTDDWLSWKVKIPGASSFDITLQCATGAGATSIAIDLAACSLTAAVPSTGDWDRYTSVEAGRVTITEPGEYMVAVRAADKATWRPINLRGVLLQRAP